MSMKVAKSIGLLYKLNRFLPEIILKTLKRYIFHFTSLHSHNTRTNNQMSILSVNRSKIKHPVLHNGMITSKSLPGVYKVNESFSTFKSKVRNLYLEKYRKILMLGSTMIAFFSDMLATAVFQV